MNALTHARSALGFSLFLMLGSAVGCATQPAEATDGNGSQALSATTTPIAGALPAGTWRGTGSYLDPADASQTGPFRSEYVVTANAMTLNFTYGPDNAPTTESVTMNVQWTSGHEFTFGVGNGQSGGKGYCMDDRCHFSAVSGDVVWFDLTVTFGASGLTTLGSKHVGDHDAYWSETLEKI
jgi:hypothetical protein